MNIHKARRVINDGSTCRNESLQFPIVEFTASELPYLKYADVGGYQRNISAGEFDGLKKGAITATRKIGSGDIPASFNQSVGGLPIQLTVYPKGSGRFILKRTGRLMHAVSAKDDRDSFTNLLSILENGFRGETTPNATAIPDDDRMLTRDERVRGDPSNLDRTRGDRYQIEFYPPRDKVKEGLGTDTRGVLESPKNSITRIHVEIESFTPDDVKKRKTEYYRKTLGKYNIPIHIT
ncbi:MAG: hypothetical protein PHG85_00385 [Candidatus Altiarchaeota archaeon]|nr:hypothetical protein [Candidatus Altiarchaeota archaeon]